ncbi:type II secretion system major pseudopilin GspG [Loktanella agnita]|uniref:type II secretion system major pseudopilin GspG n=1 Tax=Loktanella agnita TaxID=287097 RepID=UPI00398837CB
MPSFPLSFLSIPSRSRRRPTRRRGSAKGFSLVEMLVAVAIVGLLVALVGPSAIRQLQGSRVTAAEAQIIQLRSALDIFLIDTGRYPNEDEGLVVLANGGAIPGWNGPYLRDGQIPNDPWGGTYLYSLNDGQVRISSLGADGRPGGTGNDADVEG